MAPNCKNERRSYQRANMALLPECALCLSVVYKHCTPHGVEPFALLVQCWNFFDCGSAAALDAKRI